MTAIIRYEQPRLTLLDWFLKAFQSKPKCLIEPIAEQDIPQVWDLLKQIDFDHLQGDTESVALRKLQQVARNLEKRGAVVRGVYFKIDRSFPIGLIKIHNQHEERITRYLSSLKLAQGYAVGSWIWLALAFAHQVTRPMLPAPALRKMLPTTNSLRSVRIDLPTPAIETSFEAPFEAPLEVSIEEPFEASIEAQQDLTPVKPSLSYPKPYMIGQGAMRELHVGIGTVDGEWIYAPLAHGAVINPTGGGKTNLFALMMAQVRYLMAQGEPIEMFYATCKYVPIDPIDKLDQRPLIDGLDRKAVAIDMNDILSWLARVSAYAMARYNRMRSEPGWFPEKKAVVFLDELKGFFELLGDEKAGNTTYKKMASRYLKILLIMAREANMHVIFASQDCYCGSVTLTRAEMKNLGLVLIHPSSDDRSLENALGKEALTLPKGGLHDWYLFSKARSGIALVSVPRVTQGLLQTYGLTGTNIGVFLSETTLGFVAHVETPQTNDLPVEELVTSVAQRLGFSLPLALVEIENKQVQSLIKLAAKRGMKVQPIARLLFDAGSNGRFQTERIKPLVTEKS